MPDLPEGWRRVRVADIATVVGGGTPSTRDAANFGGSVPWLTPKDLSDRPARFTRGGSRSLTTKGLAACGAQLLPAGSVLVSSRAPIGLVTIAANPISTNQGFRSLVLRGDEVPEFLYYLLTSRTADLEARANGTTFKEISGSSLKGVEVLLPPASDQRRIADLLGALDDKIEANRALAARLQDLVVAEVRARENETWSAQSVSSLAKFVNGGAYTNGATGTGRMVIRIAELNSGPGPSTVYNDLDVPDDKLARRGDLLMSWSGSLGVYRWVRDEAIINQHIFKVICSTYPRWLVFAKLREALPEFQQIAADKATTMGHIKRHHLDDTRVQLPPPGEVASLDTQVGPLWDRLIVAEHESLTLAALRDTLLPELLSGRLRIAQPRPGTGGVA